MSSSVLVINPTTGCLLTCLLVVVITLFIKLGFFVAACLQPVFASPIAEPHSHLRHGPPPREHFTMTLTIVEPIFPINTRTEFPTFSGSGGLNGLPTGVAGRSSCIPTFSVLPASSTVFTEMETDTNTGTATKALRGAATRPQSVGNSQIPSSAASVSLAGSGSVGFGTMTNSGSFTGRWTMPANCQPSGMTVLTDLGTGSVDRLLPLETGSDSVSASGSLTGSLTNSATRTAATITA